MQPDITPVILAGGAGTRLRPLTSPSRPKPFIKIGRYSLLQHTALRVVGFGKPMVVTAKPYGARVLKDLDAVGVRPSSIVLEPAMRSTGPALALVAASLSADSMMLVMPSDHVIDDVDAFQTAVQEAARMAHDKDLPVLLGARPLRPATRYGYIETDGDDSVRRFLEKPCVVQAKRLLAQGDVFWNTGMFAVKAGVLLDLFRHHAPDIHGCAVAAHAASVQSGVFYEPGFFEFSKAPSISIDYAIMEKLQNARLVALSSRWNDVGCWNDFLKAKMRALIAS